MKRLYGAFILIALALLGCTSGFTEGHIAYGNASGLLSDGPLDIQDRESFRFLGKWRVSHFWLSGQPRDVRSCRYGGNPFRRLGGYGELGNELAPPMFEHGDVLYQLFQHNGVFESSSPSEWVYGINPTTGKFKGYLPFCTFGLVSPRVGLSIFIVKPDPAKGTDEWIKDAKPVKLNGLNWLLQKRPVIDISQYRADTEPDATVENWVLKIPDTAYWMVLKLYASSGKSDSKYKTGTIYHPAEWQRIQDLFHQIVASVRLEPITPVPLPNGLSPKELVDTPTTKPNTLP